jgi:hypothetical protein
MEAGASTSRGLHSIHPVPVFANRQYDNCGHVGGPPVEHVFDIRGCRVSNVCSVQGSGSGHGDGGDEMEMLLKVLLVGYVMYAVLGAPMLAHPRERI